MSEIVKELGSTDFAEKIADGVALVDFWATWCGPCRLQLPVLEDLAKEFQNSVTIAKVNVDDADDVAGQFGIHAIPTLILFDNGKEVKRFIGVQNKQALSAEIQKIQQ